MALNKKDRNPLKRPFKKDRNNPTNEKRIPLIFPIILLKTGLKRKGYEALKRPFKKGYKP